MAGLGWIVLQILTLKELRSYMRWWLTRDTFRRFTKPKLAGTGQLSDGKRGKPSGLW